MCWSSLHKSVRLVFSAPLIAVFLTGAAPAEVIANYASGVWQGGAETRDDGTLLHCYLAAQSKDKGYLILLRWDESGFHITLVDKTWNLNVGETFVSRVRIDRRFNKDVAGKLLTSRAIDFAFGFDKTATNSAGKGNSIKLQSPQGEFGFRLKGTSKAIGVLQNCAVAQNYPLEQPLDQGSGALANVAGDYDAGMKANRAKDYQTALAIWSKLAREGDAKAQNAIGVMYYTGHGVAKDRAKAAEWYLKSAQNGYVSAQYNIGIMFRDGVGVAQDYTQAGHWFDQAAQQGHKRAKAILASMYARNLLQPDTVGLAGNFRGNLQAGNGTIPGLNGAIELQIDGETVTGTVTGTLQLVSGGVRETVKGPVQGKYNPQTGDITLALRAFGAKTSVRGSFAGVQSSDGFAGKWAATQGLDGSWTVTQQ